LDSTPPDFTGNVHFMLNRDNCQSVMTYALVENAEEFDRKIKRIYFLFWVGSLE
jgi:hypothetical protein